jgi:hypothetical protein
MKKYCVVFLILIHLLNGCYVPPKHDKNLTTSEKILAVYPIIGIITIGGSVISVGIVHGAVGALYFVGLSFLPAISIILIDKSIKIIKDNEK